MKENKPLVAVYTLVYNHEPFLRDYFEGIIMQKTNFPFIAIVHDDCSTDGSAAIIREYAEKYPDIIKPIFEEINCYQNDLWERVEKKMEAAYKDAKYIAFCEGDDYWTDPLKLQRQVDFMESNSNYSAIAENGLVKNLITNKEFVFNEADSHDVTLEEVIITRRFPTAGVLCRQSYFSEFKHTSKYSIDTIMWCWFISKGSMRYDKVVSSVYRRGNQGMTLGTEPYHFARECEKWHDEMLRLFDLRKDFMYIHTAKMYKSFIEPALKHRHIGSALKCLLRGGYFTAKGLLYKILPNK